MPQTVQGDISKDIVSGIAITCLIFAVSIYLPIMGFFCALFIPLPVLLYRSKLGRTFGSVVPAVAAIAMIAVVGGITIDLLFFVELLLLGFVLGELFEMNLSVEKTVLYACGAVLLAGLIGVFFYSQIANKGIDTLLSEYVEKNLEQTLVLYRNMGVSEDTLHLISSARENILYALVRIIPSLVIASTLFAAWASLLMARPLLKSKNLFYPGFGSLSLWKVPEVLVWGAIGSGLMLLIPDRMFKVFGINGLIILTTIYFFGGIAIVSFYFEKKRFPRMLRIFLYSLLALQQLLVLIVVGIGFFDTWLNFRKLGANKSG